MKNGTCPLWAWKAKLLNTRGVAHFAYSLTSSELSQLLQIFKLEGKA